MKVFAAVVGLAALSLAKADEVSPIQKVLELITGLQGKVISEGEKSQKIYEEFSEWCEETNKNLAFEIKTAKAEIVELKAVISEEAAVIASLTTKTEELAAKIQTDQQDLKAATFIRDNEATEFEAEKFELDEIISSLSRAIGIIEKNAESNPALLQTKGEDGLVKAFKVMVDAAAFSADDAARLTALVQQSDSSTEDEEEEDEQAPDGAPDPAVYKEHSAGILEVLHGLLEKAETQLGNARNKESKSLFEFQQLKQSIEDALAYAEKELAEAKQGINEAGEKKATAEGDLEVTSKDLAEDVKALAELHANCMTKAEEFESETKSRAEELEALAQAKKVLNDTTSGASDVVGYSLMQVRSDQHFEAVRFVRDLARKHNAPVLAQLANRMATVISQGQGSDADIFAKVKGLIAAMIATLEEEQAADAKHKAYCDKELSYASEKKDKRVGEIEKLTTAIDQMSAKSAQLKEEVAILEKELADISQEQAEMNKIREEEKAAFEENKKDLELGISGVKKALKVLRDYYAKDHDHAANEGAGTGIIGLLEVCESDFEKALNEAIGDEDSSQASYDKETKENEVETAAKQQDVKYKTKESKDLDKATAEAKSDRENVQEELDAVNKYLEKLHEQCDEVAEPYEETVRRRTAEIAGLKQALEILEGEAAMLVQTGRSLRRVSLHKAI
jgi:predicted  nucleic acid-binding Zn-ribbon protein